MKRYLKKLSRASLVGILVFQAICTVTVMAATSKDSAMRLQMPTMSGGTGMHLEMPTMGGGSGTHSHLPTIVDNTAIEFQKNAAEQVQNQKKVVGYFTDGKGFDPINVNLDQLTHLHYAYIVIDENGLPTFQDPAMDTSQGRNNVEQLAKLTKEHGVTLMMAVGGRQIPQQLPLMRSLQRRKS